PGYEYAKEQHVIMSDENFDKLPLPSRRTIELAAFVKAEEIDPVYYEKSYYLEPDEGGIKPFALLMRALMELIEAKLQGEEFVEAPEPAPANVTDLMAALKASVAAAKKRRGEEAE